MQTMSTHGMQTPNHLEFHVHVSYSWGELLTWIATFPIISERCQQQSNLGTKGKSPQSSPPSLIALPLLQCRHTYPSQSKILLLLLPKSWCSLCWYCDAEFLHHNMLHCELQSRTGAYKMNTGENRWTFHGIYNGSDKLVGRPELCQPPTNSIQCYLVMYDRVCLRLGHCLVCFLRNIVPAYFHRVITPFLNNIVPVYFMTHIIPTVKSGNIGNIHLLKAPIDLIFFLSSFRPPVILDVYHLTHTPLQIQVTSSHPPCHSSER